MSIEDPTLWKQIAIALLALYGGVVTFLWKHAVSVVRTKADRDELQGIIKRLDKKFDEDREDRQRIFTRIDSVACAFHTHAEMVIRELGERPRRDELRRNGNGNGAGAK